MLIFERTHSVRMKNWLLLFILSLSSHHQSLANNLRVKSNEDGKHVAAGLGVVLTLRLMGCQQHLVNLVLRENIKWIEAKKKKLTGYELGTSNLYNSFSIENTSIIQEINKQINFTVMLPCSVTNFFLNSQTDAPVIQIYSVIKLYMFRVSSLPIIRCFLLYIRHW